MISKAVDAITGMCSLKLFDMPKMLEFVDHIRPLLFHPVRKAATSATSRNPAPWQHVESLMKATAVCGSM